MLESVLFGVQRAIDVLGERAADARHLRDLFDAGSFDSGYTAEVSEQFTAPFRANT